MKTLTFGGNRPAYVVEEPAADYLRLLDAAREVSAHIVATGPDGMTGAANYIRSAGEEIIAAVGDGKPGTLASDGAIYECLRRVSALWPDLATGKIEGEQAFSSDPGLWKRAMTEWPMGGFARMTADFMIENELLGGSVVELGAGVGSCSALVAAHVTDRYIRTDLQPSLLKRQKIVGTVERYDFNEPGAWRNLDTIFAVNALHCAKDKSASLCHLHAMLHAGGVLVLGEGRPHTDDRGTPWALNPFFGLFRGWWDIGGFVRRKDWITAARQAGFSDVGFAARTAGAHDLGGVIWAVK